MRDSRLIVAFDRSVIVTPCSPPDTSSYCSIRLQTYGAALHVEDPVQVRATREHPFTNADVLRARAIAGIAPPTCVVKTLKECSAFPFPLSR